MRTRIVIQLMVEEIEYSELNSPQNTDSITNNPYSLSPKFTQIMNECHECDANWECSICFIKKEEVSGIERTSCGHYFCRTCMNNIKDEVKDSTCTFIATPCPLCRTAIIIDDGTSLQLFMDLAECKCCDRHQLNRPPTYDFWELPSNPNSNTKEECSCICRHTMRALVRRLQK